MNDIEGIQVFNIQMPEYSSNVKSAMLVITNTDTTCFIKGAILIEQAHRLIPKDIDKIYADVLLTQKMDIPLWFCIRKNHANLYYPVDWLQILNNQFNACAMVSNKTVEDLLKIDLSICIPKLLEPTETLIITS